MSYYKFKKQQMFDVRCRNCNTLLLRENLRDGCIEIKCPRCNAYNTIDRIVLDNRNGQAYNDYKKKSESP